MPEGVPCPQGGAPSGMAPAQPTASSHASPPPLADPAAPPASSAAQVPAALRPPPAAAALLPPPAAAIPQPPPPEPPPGSAASGTSVSTLSPVCPAVTLAWCRRRAGQQHSSRQVSQRLLAGHERRQLRDQPGLRGTRNPGWRLRLHLQLWLRHCRRCVLLQSSAEGCPGQRCSQAAQLDHVLQLKGVKIAAAHCKLSNSQPELMVSLLQARRQAASSTAVWRLTAAATPVAAALLQPLRHLATAQVSCTALLLCHVSTVSRHADFCAASAACCLCHSTRCAKLRLLLCCSILTAGRGKGGIRQGVGRLDCRHLDSHPRHLVWLQVYSACSVP